MKDTVSLIKKNGEKTDGIRANVQKRKIFINLSDFFRPNILIETGDLILRKMSNGGEETYEVIDPGFNESSRNTQAGYQMEVKKVTPHADSLAKDSKNLESVSTGAKTIFISHAAEDTALAKALKSQLNNVFKKKVNVFVSSIPGTIRPGSDWLGKIIDNLTGNNAFIVLITPNSKERPFVWFEIGFSWFRKLKNMCETYAICAPPINPGKLPEPLRRLQNISLDNEEQTKAFFESLIKQFELGNLDALEFAKIRDSLPTYPSQIEQTENIDISGEAKTLLIETSKDTKGDIIKTLFGNGTTKNIQIGSKNMVPSKESRIIAKWEHALNELDENDFIEAKAGQGVFAVTHKGYEYADKLKKDAAVLQDKSSAGTSASVQQDDDLKFDPKTGTYFSEKDNLRYCGKCLKSTPPNRVHLTEQNYGWECNVCDKSYYKPNDNPPRRARNNLGPMAM